MTLRIPRSLLPLLPVASFVSALALHVRAEAQPPPAEPATTLSAPAPTPEASAATLPPPPVSTPPPSPVVPPPPAATPAAPAAPAIVLGDLSIRPMLQARFRYEGRVNPYGNGVPAATNANFVTTRLRVGLDARWKMLRVMAQLQDVRNLGTFPGQDDGSKFGLHQGFLEVGNGRAYMRLGRQEIAYGDERMIGPLDWQMAARSVDALRIHNAIGKLELDVFGGMVRPQTTYTVPAANPGGMATTVQSRGDYLASIYATYTASPNFLVDGYVLYRHDGPLDTAPTRDRDIVSPGVRLNGKFLPTLGYTTELTVQSGRANGDTFFAYAATADVRYTPTTKLKPLVGAGFVYGSGARRDGRVDGFDNFFPTNHKFYGFADLFNLQNQVNVHATAQLRPDRIPATFRVDAYYYRQQVTGSQWTNASGQVLGQAQGDSKSLGTEVDLTVTYTPMPKLVLSGGYSAFMPLSAAERLGHDETQHWFFVSLGVETP